MENEELSPELTEFNTAAMADVWDEDVPEEEAEATEDTHSEEEPADSEETEESEEPENETAEEPDEGEEAADAPAGNTFTLKHMGENKEVGLEEMLTLASKGMDYDGLKADRDRLRDDPEVKHQRAFLAELAKRSGAADAAELETRIRAAWLQQDEKSAGREITEADAILRVQRGSEKAEAKQAETETAPTEQPTEAPRKDTMFRAFIDEFPQVKATDIPQEVWSECAKTGDLAGAYRKYEYARMKAENETLRKNQENRNRSTGSRKSSSAPKPKSIADEIWDSD